MPNLADQQALAKRRGLTRPLTPTTDPGPAGARRRFANPGVLGQTPDMTGVESISVRDDEDDLRLDRWFRQHFPALGHGRLERLLRTGQVRVDGRRAKSGTRLVPGQVVRVPPLKLDNAPAAVSAPSARPAAPVSEADAIALRAAVLFEDDWVVALNKPAGLAVQGGTGQTRYLDAMLGALNEEGQAPRLVHRLDRDTSGVLLLAKSALSARRLGASFKGRDTKKIYWALVVGTPETPRGRIDLALTKKPGKGGEKMGAVEAKDGKSAQTLYRAIDTWRQPKRGGKSLTWLVLMPLTGRTHQLRAHCAAMGTPIAGDGKYGGRDAFVEGVAKQLMLHARELTLPHPDDGTTLRVTATLPPHMEAAWQALGFDMRKAERTVRELLDYAEGLAHSPPGTVSRPRARTKAKARPKAKPKGGQKPKSRAQARAKPKPGVGTKPRPKIKAKAKSGTLARSGPKRVARQSPAKKARGARSRR